MQCRKRSEGWFIHSFAASLLPHITWQSKNKLFQSCYCVRTWESMAWECKREGERCQERQEAGMNNMRNSNEITSSVTNFCCSDSLMGVQSRRLLLWVQTKTKINSLSRQEVKDTLFALCSDSSMTSRQELPPQEELSDFECQTLSVRLRMPDNDSFCLWRLSHSRVWQRFYSHFPRLSLLLSF